MLPAVVIGLAIVTTAWAVMSARQREQPPATESSSGPRLEAGTVAPSGGRGGISDAIARGSKYGAIGLFVSVMFSAIAQAWQDPLYSWEWLSWGMPCVRGTWEDGPDEQEYHLPLPSEDGTGVSVLVTPRSMLEEMWGAAFASAEAAGLFTWRPHEVDVDGNRDPFGTYLYQAAPWLTEYEREHFQGSEGVGPGDTGHVRYQRPTFEELSRDYTTPAGAIVSFHQFDPRKISMEGADQAKLTATLHAARRLAWGCAADGRFATNVHLDHMVADLLTALDEGKDWVTRYILSVDDTLETMIKGIVYSAKQVSARVLESAVVRIYGGLRGAWRYTESPATHAPVTAGTVFSATGGERAGVTAIIAGLAVDSTSVGITAEMQSILEPEPEHTRIEVWLPISGWELERHVVELERFGSGARADLEAGRLAWGPATSTSHLATWKRIQPRLDSSWAEAFRVGSHWKWKPENPWEYEV